MVITRDAPIIDIGRLSAVMPITSIGRLVRWYRTIVIYTTDKYKFLLHGVSMVKLLCLKGGGSL